MTSSNAHSSLQQHQSCLHTCQKDLLAVTWSSSTAGPLLILKATSSGVVWWCVVVVCGVVWCGGVVWWCVVWWCVVVVCGVVVCNCTAQAIAWLLLMSCFNSYYRLLHQLEQGWRFPSSIGMHLHCQQQRQHHMCVQHCNACTESGFRTSWHVTFDAKRTPAYSMYSRQAMTVYILDCYSHARPEKCETFATLRGRYIKGWLAACLAALYRSQV